MLMQSAKPLGELEDSHEFVARHIGVSEADQALMLQAVGAESRRALMARIVPASIARQSAMAIPAPLSEAAALDEMRAIASRDFSPPDSILIRLSTSSPENWNAPASERSEPKLSVGKSRCNCSNTVKSAASTSSDCCAK